MLEEKETATILLVDDDEAIRSMYADLFRNNGYKVIEAEDGVEGLDIATKESPIDVIFTGIIMPRMDGFQLVQSLKEYTETADIPVVVNSHLGREEDRKKMVELGARDFIVQGVTSPNDALRRVIQCMGKGEYTIGIVPDKFEGLKFLQDNKLPIDLKCPKCGEELALRLKYHRENNFKAWIVCVGCEQQQK